MDRKVIQLSRNIINGIPHLLLGGESGSGKSRVLYGLIYKFLGDNKDNLFICDGKGEKLYNVGKYILDLPNVGRSKEEIFDYIKDVENLMDRRFQGRFKDQIRFS